MVPVARRNLFAEKGRFAISVAGVAFAVLLILIVLALYRGFNRTGQTFRDLPGELWVVQRGTSDPFHSVSLIERAQLDPLAATPASCEVPGGALASRPLRAPAVLLRLRAPQGTARQP